MASELLGGCAEVCPYAVIPVRMFWKASSTLLASRAEVSMKERLFSPIICQCLTGAVLNVETKEKRTGKLLGFLCGNSS